jgi:hypothetical protein
VLLWVLLDLLAAINTVKDFEQGNANLASVLGKPKKEIRALTEDAKRLGAQTSFSATQVSQLQTEFAKLGFNEKEILNATEATLDLAAATGSDLGEAAAIAGATLGGFGLDASETQRVTDVMAKSFSTSALDMDKFKESMKSAAPAAKAVGVDVETTTALLGTMANAGISGSKAGNALKNTFINLNKEGLTLNEGFDEVNNSSDKLATAVELVGKESAAAFLVMAEGVSETNKLEKGLRNAGGAAKRMADTQLDTLEGKLKILDSAWEGFVLGLLDGEGAFNDISKGLVELATNILGLITPSQSLTDQWRQQVSSVNKLENEVSPLLDRYDELKEKTELTREEQEELDSIIQKVAQDVPSAITEFDKYGKAMDISTGAAKRFIEQQKNLILVKNKEAIEEQEDNLIQLERVLVRLNDKYKTTKDGLQIFDLQLARATNNAKRFRNATAEEVAEYQNRLNELNSNIDGTKALIAELKGEKTAVEEAAEAEEESNKKLKENTEEKKKNTKETEKLVGLIEIQKKVISDLNKELEKATTEEQIKNIQKRVKYEQNTLDKLLNKKIEDEVKLSKEREMILNKEIQKKIITDTSEADRLAKKAQDELDLRKKTREAIRDASIQVAQETSDAIFSIQKQNIDRRKQYEIDQLAILDERRQDELQSQLDRGIISQQEYENNRAALAEETALKREEIEKEAFKKQKRLDTAQAIINGALAITKTIAQLGGVGAITPAGAVALGTVAASTAIQVATIQAQKFAKGGILEGASHDQGGIPAVVDGSRPVELEGGEAIINKRSVAMFKDQLSYINQAGGGVPLFERGGYVPKYAQGGMISSSADLSGIADAISNSKQTIRVINDPRETISTASDAISVENEFTI